MPIPTYDIFEQR